MSDLIRFLALGALSLSCFLAGRRSNVTDRRALRFMGGLAAILGLLLITDTIGASVETFRSIARNDGLYQRRRPFQAAVIVAVIIACLLALPALLRIARKTSRHIQAALVGMTILCGFLVVRAISLHQVDAILNRRRGLPRLNLGDSFELMLIVGIALLVQLRRSTSLPRQDRPQDAPESP
ncbi:MAG: hypothetical protein AB7N24_20395 [Dehalococcoidia bacterium]